MSRLNEVGEDIALRNRLARFHDVHCFREPTIEAAKRLERAGLCMTWLDMNTGCLMAQSIERSPWAMNGGGAA